MDGPKVVRIDANHGTHLDCTILKEEDGRIVASQATLRIDVPPVGSCVIAVPDPGVPGRWVFP